MAEVTSSKVGVDFGGTQIKAALVQGGTVQQSLTIDTPDGANPGEVIDLIAGAVTRLAPKPDAFGIAIPGEVDSNGKVWRLPNVPGFESVNLAAELAERTGARVTVENDGTTAAFAESLFGHGRQHKSFLMVTLGTGIGGGLVVCETLVRGSHGFGAEIGHIPIDSAPDAWKCGCGERGCVEAYAGTRGLLKRYRQLGKDADEVSDIAEAARQGEQAARDVFDFMGRALGRAFVAVQNILDLDAFVFTGGISASFDLIEPSLRAALRERAFAEPLGEVPLLVSDLGSRAGVVGAANLPRAS